MESNNILSEEDIALIKESLNRSAIASDKLANDLQFPAIVRAAMKQAASKYRSILEKISFEAKPAVRRIK